MEGLLAAGLKPLRVGYSGKIKASLHEYTLEAKLEQHPLRPKHVAVEDQIKALEKALKALILRIEELRKVEKAKYNHRIRAMEEDLLWRERQLGAMKRKAYAIYLEMVRDVVLQADVVCISIFDWRCFPAHLISGLHNLYHCCD